MESKLRLLASDDVIAELSSDLKSAGIDAQRPARLRAPAGSSRIAGYPGV